MKSAFSEPLDPFADRHLGLSDQEVGEMLAALGFESLEELSDGVVPASIRLDRPLELGSGTEEHASLETLAAMAGRNRVLRSFIGLGYHNSRMPEVIRRNLLENPGWYTQYTPYQAEIAQGRLEILVTFQTLVADLTGLPLANSSLLDEATAAAEAMGMCRALARGRRQTFVVAEDCHPQTLAVVQTRAEPLGIDVQVGNPWEMDLAGLEPLGVLAQYPATDGSARDLSKLAERTHAAGGLLIAATDLLALTLLKPPGEMGADIAVGSSQRLGVPLGFGGPHAAFFAVRSEYERSIPGRITGISKDAAGNDANRLARQTREQHIRRERATSNICTAQVLPAVLAAMYAVYHGPERLRAKAERARLAALTLAAGLRDLGADTGSEPFFDTVQVALDGDVAGRFVSGAHERGINLRDNGDGSVAIALDETVTGEEIAALLEAFAAARGEGSPRSVAELAAGVDTGLPPELTRDSGYLQQEVFNRYHSEHDFLRYVFALQARDLSLVHSMIPLGSCTMKLNASAEMVPVTWPEFANLHPYAPADQAAGYGELFEQLCNWLAEITGLPAVSLQPNAGSQGELASLLAIRAYHAAQGSPDRDVCLIPTSAHGTNPASAVMAGLRVVGVRCDSSGNVDLDDLRAKSGEHADRLAAIMVTYPSTHGVFESAIREICEIVHAAGGQVFLDGANMNAQVGLCRPGDYGADICHLNLHKTFCIPHGGGGPGMGPICGAPHLQPFLPAHPLAADGAPAGPVSAAPFGSPGILPISWMYISMMGGPGLLRASQIAILNANYMAKRLAEHYPVLYTGETGFVAHEFILDLREFKKSADVTVDDVAKRLMDYGFHAPTMSWPVAGTMMLEPTESESREELDRLCEAMIAIRSEIREIESGAADRADNLLKNAPHTALAVTADDWSHPYSRERAAFPTPWTRQRKFWPPVARIDNAFGDRNLVCTCDPVESYAEPA